MRKSSKVRTSPRNQGGSALSIVNLALGFNLTPAGPPLLWLPPHARQTPPAPCCRAPPAAVGPLICFAWCPPPEQNTILSGLRKANRSRLGCERNLPDSIELYSLATAGPAVSAPAISRRSLGGRLSTMETFVRDHTGKCRAIGHGRSRPSPKRVREFSSVTNYIQTPLCAVKRRMIRPQ